MSPMAHEELAGTSIKTNAAPTTLSRRQTPRLVTMSSDHPFIPSRDAVNHRQMLHRLSTHSSNTSNSSKRGSRVTKTTPCSSPHNVQRRRTNPTHSTRSFPRIVQDNPYATRDQRLKHYYSQYSMDANRPMSWHPGSERMQSSYPPMPTLDPALGNTIAGFESLAVTGTPQPSVQQSIQDAFSMAYGFSMSQTPTDYIQPISFPQNEPSVAAVSSHLTHPFPTQYPPYEDRVPVEYPGFAQDPTYDMYNLLSDYGLPPQPQAQPPLNFTSPIPYYQTSTETPWQEPPIDPQNTIVHSVPRLQRKKSKELVGLGLYDDKKEDFLSSLNSEANRESLGKDLKLEETWQPPPEDENEMEEEEEAYSSDEAEEEAPEVPNFVTQTLAEPPTFYPTYGDMSNQSFFFNDDEQQVGQDAPYVNYVAFGAEDQPKVQPLAGTGNIGWL